MCYKNRTTPKATDTVSPGRPQSDRGAVGPALGGRPGPLLLQWRLAARGLLRQLDLGQRDQDLRPRLEVSGLEQRLLLGAAVGRHHGERVDQRLIGRILDTLPVGLEIVGLEELGE